MFVTEGLLKNGLLETCYKKMARKVRKKKATGVYVVCSSALHFSRKSGITKKCVLVTRTSDCRKDTRDDLDDKMPL